MRERETKSRIGGKEVLTDGLRLSTDSEKTRLYPSKDRGPQSKDFIALPDDPHYLMDLADALRNHARSIKAQKSLGYDPHIVTLIKFKEDTL